MIRDQRTTSREKLSNLDDGISGRDGTSGAEEKDRSAKLHVRAAGRPDDVHDTVRSRYQVRSAPVTGEPEPGIGYGKLPCTH